MASMQRQPSQPRRQIPAANLPPAQDQSPEQDAGENVDDSVEAPEETTEAESQQTEETPITTTQAETQQRGQIPVTATQTLSIEDDPSIKKCWICFSDSTEDLPETSPWRDPCPCALVAHEACLLDWIADMESPKNSTRGITGPQILCPQCKSEIKLARPQSYIVNGVRALDRLTGRLVMPGGAIVLSVDLLCKISFAHGIHSIYRIFGSTDAERILFPVMQQWVRPPIDFDLTLPEIRDRALTSLSHYARHWRLYLGIPLITPSVLLSRTNWHFSEAFLTVLPTVFFALQPSTPDEIFELGKWPPSASMAFALLPYARQAYNLYYERVWGEKERRWKREVLPPTSQSRTEEGAERDPAERIEEAVDDTNVFEIRVDGGIWEEPEGDAAENVAENAQEQAAPAPDVPDNRAAAQPQREVAGERRLQFSPAAVAENVLGALAFPTIAELSGEVLRLVLPKTWTTSNVLLAAGGRSMKVGSKGLLHEKWGRSLIGGCLFVVLKDALMLYVRWKMAQMHRNRRIVDYDRSKARRNV